jgi:UDP-N-acetylglucosamine--N-acetylmuramyl-(pentapeptide) pyrophosphoryl-undecaprenol N-acetylglucosamine transferase
VFWLGTRDGMEGALVRQHGVDFEGVAFAASAAKAGRPRSSGRSRSSRVHAEPQDHPPTCAGRRSGIGGFASVPGALAGIATSTPLVLHDANAIAGLANRLLAYAAKKVLLGFPDAMRGKHAGKVEWVGNPVSDAIARVPRPETRFAGRTGPLSLLVVGGSLGASAINRCVPKALALIPAGHPPRASSIRRARATSMRCARRTRGSASTPSAYRSSTTWRRATPAADLVLCRGGAITVAELAAVGVASIIVPLPGAIADEQSANADFLVDAGAAQKSRNWIDARALAGTLHRSLARRCSRWPSPHTSSRARMPPFASPTPASPWGPSGEAQGQTRALRRRRRRGMSGIAEVLVTQGYRVPGPTRGNAGHGAPRSTGRGHSRGSFGGEHCGRRRRRRLDRGRCRQSEVAAARERGIPIVPRR